MAAMAAQGTSRLTEPLVSALARYMSDNDCMYTAISKKCGLSYGTVFCVSKPAGDNSRKRLLQDLRIAELVVRHDGMWCCAYLGRGYFHCDGCPADDNCAGYVISDIAARVRAVFGGEQDA